MRILLTNSTLADRSGSELYVLALMTGMRDDEGGGEGEDHRPARS
jgi:hypothetical protein